jgi:hypothetical protein
MFKSGVRFSALSLVAVISVGTWGCGQSAVTRADLERLRNEVKPREQRRFEIHSIRNGTYYGSVLLDTHTGRVWALGSESKGGKVTDVSFAEIPVLPDPRSSDRDPLGILTGSTD